MLQKHKQALLVRLRQNLLLKSIALISSVLLFFYVQSERNPIQSRSFMVRINQLNIPDGIEVELESHQIEVNITGPRATVERIKEGDIRAEVDFRGVVADEQKPQSLKVKCFVNGLTTSAQKELTMEPSPQRIRALVYLPITRRFAVIPVYPKELPAGLRYEKPILRPEMVRVIGRPDRVNRVERIVLIAEAIENGARIEGDYTPQARDKYDNPVEGVTLSPTTVHLAIPVAEEPLVKVVNISPDISDLPLPPHTLTEVRATPRSVRIMGRPERLAQISTIETETIAVGDFTETQEIVANLIIPPDIQVLDTANRPIKQVKIRIGIRKPTATATPPVTNPGNAPPPPNENKTEGVRPGSS